jgi:hypothetical protein
MGQVASHWRYYLNGNSYQKKQDLEPGTAHRSLSTEYASRKQKSESRAST